MEILKKIFIIFLLTFPTGVLLRIQFSNGLAISLNDIVLLILILSWLFYKVKVKNFEKKHFLLKPISLFLIICIFSLIINYLNLGFSRFLVSFSYFARFLGYVSLYFIVKDFSNKFKLTIGKYLLISGSLVVIIGYIQYFLYPSLKGLFYLGWDIHLYRMVSVFLDPNFAGTFFNIYFIYALDYLRKNFKNLSKIKSFLLFLITLLSFFAIYLTYSRSALIMLFVSFTAYLFLLKKKKLIGVAVIILFLLIFISPRAFQTEGTNLLRIVSSNERIHSLQIALKVINENPLFGVGFNAYRYAQNRLGLDNIYWQITHSGAGTDASFIFVIATTGFVGFFVFLYLIYKIFMLAKLNLKGNGIILFSIMLGIIANSFFVNSFFYIFILEWIWILGGLTENS